jgi:hypothetical protein
MLCLYVNRGAVLDRSGRGDVAWISGRNQMVIRVHGIQEMEVIYC